MGIRLSAPLAVLVGAVLAAGLIAGCGGGRSTGAPATPGGSVSPSSSPTPPSTPPPSPGAAGEMTLTGTVEPGVEAGCMLMRSGDKLYLLVGGDRAVVKAGARVTVRGMPSPQLVSYCQQGEPFQVLEAHPA